MGVLPKGKWACETGGDATGATGIRQPEMDFVVTRGSSYKTDKGAGTYLLTSHRLVFSTGPFKGVTLRWVRPNFIRRTDAAGKDTDVRCVRNPANR